jgi:hypothetical protein
LVIIGAISIQFTSIAASLEVWISECAYFLGNEQKAPISCVVKVYATVTSATEKWEWDNGNHSVVKMSDDDIFDIDQKAEEFDGKQILAVEETHCYEIKTTNKVYCWGIN